MRHSLTAGNDIVQIVECSATADEGWQYSFRRGAMIFAPAPGPRSWKSRQPTIVCCALMTTHNIGGSSRNRILALSQRAICPSRASEGAP
jgi:hypothetical protein